MFSHRPPTKSTALPLTEVSVVTNDLNNVGNDDEPEKFDFYFVFACLMLLGHSFESIWIKIAYHFIQNRI